MIFVALNHAEFRWRLFFSKNMSGMILSMMTIVGMMRLPILLLPQLRGRSVTSVKEKTRTSLALLHLYNVQARMLTACADVGIAVPRNQHLLSASAAVCLHRVFT